MDPTLIPSDGSAAERPEETGGGLALDPEAEPSAVRLDALLTADPKFRRSWGQDRKDQSPTAYNLSMATMAMGVGWSDQEVVNLLICWRRKHGHDLKLGEGYYEIILSKAKEPIVMAQAQEQLEEALLLRPEDHPEVLKAKLKTLFRVDIIRIVKYVGEPPVYYMYTKQGDITLGEISSITSQTKFQNLVAAATDVWIPAVSRKEWDQRIQAILLVCEPIDVGDASHLAQETRLWLAKYLLKKPPREDDEWEKAAEARQPFVRHGRVYVFIDDLQWLEVAGKPDDEECPGATAEALHGPTGAGQHTHREHQNHPDMLDAFRGERAAPGRRGQNAGGAAMTEESKIEKSDSEYRVVGPPGCGPGWETRYNRLWNRG